jgi:hypothetical protein
MIDPRL